MNLDGIENLNKEDLNELYDDILEFGDNTYLAACCCANGDKFPIWSSWTYDWLDYSSDGFRRWCVSTCLSWHDSVCSSWGGPNGDSSDCSLGC